MLNAQMLKIEANPDVMRALCNSFPLRFEQVLLESITFAYISQYKTVVDGVNSVNDERKI